jgi:hypothetical protein
LLVRQGWNSHRQPRQRGHGGGGDRLKPHRRGWWRHGVDRRQHGGDRRSAAEGGRKGPDVPDTRLIGFQVLPVISRSAYGWLGFGGREREQRWGVVGAGRVRQEGGGGEAARVWGAVESPGSLREAGNNRLFLLNQNQEFTKVFMSTRLSN